MRERIIVRKFTAPNDRPVDGDRRRGHVEVEADDGIADRVNDRLR